MGSCIVVLMKEGGAAAEAELHRDDGLVLPFRANLIQKKRVFFTAEHDIYYIKKLTLCPCKPWVKGILGYLT